MPLTDYKKHGNRFGHTNPIMICHDQEPLNHDLYGPAVMLDLVQWLWRNSVSRQWLDPLFQEMSQWNLRSRVELYNIYDRVLLLHSERNSEQVTWYQNRGFVPVYYWSHALIARDWFRYAQHDCGLDAAPNYTRPFLVYNRAWAGTREYRLTFAQGLIDQDLVPHCQTSFAANCDGTDYRQHQFVNPDLAIERRDLERYFEPNITVSSASADYHGPDYQSCMIEVVLETLFDDSRCHLTEKALRPIACGRPFMLAATAGSLAYLRSYGFRTFAPLIDESYDQIPHPRERIESIQREMRRIANLGPGQRADLYAGLQEIAQHNRLHFFSDRFHDQVVGEYVNNITQALTVMEHNRQGQHLARVKQILDAIPDRPRDSVDRVDRLYHTLMQWNQDPQQVPENW